MKPLISYYGGKQRLAPTIIQLMPIFSTYVEPFCGGASVFFAMPRDDRRCEVLNDKDSRITTLYRVAKLDSERLIAMIEATPFSRACYKEACEVWKNPEKYNDLEIAWAVYVATMQAFSNVTATGWEKAHIVGAVGPVPYKSAKSRLRDQIERLDHAYIESDDALKVIERWDSKDSFFYIDPPYPNTEQGHYKGYTLSDYENLIDLLATIKGKFILSNYEQPVTLPDRWRKVEIELACSVKNVGRSKASRRTEVLLMNCSSRQASFFDAEWDG